MWDSRNRVVLAVDRLGCVQLRMSGKIFLRPMCRLLKHEKRKQEWVPYLTWAAGELLATTGEEKYNDYFVEHLREAMHWSRRGIRWWAYLRCEKELVDNDLRAELICRLLEDADKCVATTDEAAYRMGNGRGTACGWGACQGANHGDLLLRAYILTDDPKYVDAACLNADWHLGANPLSKTLLTGMGYRFPRRPEISWYLYEEPERDMSRRHGQGDRHLRHWPAAPVAYRRSLAPLAQLAGRVGPFCRDLQRVYRSANLRPSRDPLRHALRDGKGSGPDSRWLETGSAGPVGQTGIEMTAAPPDCNSIRFL